ncbi:hypothetical protein [Flavilitoribacter nigricans]|nr:hypothetical protein [Flavilitoribacter nigricans]
MKQINSMLNLKWLAWIGILGVLLCSFYGFAFGIYWTVIIAFGQIYFMHLFNLIGHLFLGGENEELRRDLIWISISALILFLMTPQKVVAIWMFFAAAMLIVIIQLYGYLEDKFRGIR